jgi:hypothetical protein
LLHQGAHAVDACLRAFRLDSASQGGVSIKPNNAREAAIRRILDARFSLAALEVFRTSDPGWWNSTRNDMGRGIYAEALRESRRLEDVTDAEIEAELAAIAFK